MTSIEAEQQWQMAIARPRAVYIHIPFCKHKCFYCDFNTYALHGQPVDEYIEALRREMRLTAEQAPFAEIETLFVGGGTPTILTPQQMERFLLSLDEVFTERSPNLEFTMEANPGTVDADKLAVMKAGGVNRLSFGAQTFNDVLLKKIGRIHQSEDIVKSIEMARQAGFQNISLDLMFGLPGQSLQDVEESLEVALDLKLQHYSIYSLKIEPNTPFHAMHEKDELPLPSEDVELAMFERIIEMMSKAGYNHYEISNFARSGYEGRHNLQYWHNQSYYGFGAGAHGYVDGCRYMNIKAVKAYIDSSSGGLPRADQEQISRAEAMEDFMMVGLRVLDGVDYERFVAQFGQPLRSVFGAQIDRLVHQGLLTETAQGCRLTRRGLIYGNEVFAAFLQTATSA